MRHNSQGPHKVLWGSLGQQTAVEAQCRWKVKKAATPYTRVGKCFAQPGSFAIVRPILLYGAVVWWTGLQKSTYRKPIARVQRPAALCIAGTLRTPPTAALELVLSLRSIDLFAENWAAKSSERLLAAGEFTYTNFGHSSVCSCKYRLHDPTFQMGKKVQSKHK